MTTTKERYYDLCLPQEMSDDISKLAHEIGGDLSDVFTRAMRLYYAVKTNQLNHKKGIIVESPYLNVFLVNEKGEHEEFTNF